MGREIGESVMMGGLTKKKVVLLTWITSNLMMVILYGTAFLQNLPTAIQNEYALHNFFMIILMANIAGPLSGLIVIWVLKDLWKKEESNDDNGGAT